MKFYYFYLQICFYFISSNADPRCPFPSCSSSYHLKGCSIYCSSDEFPNITNPIPSNKIYSLSFRNLKHFPNKSFDSLFINHLYIYGNNLTTIDLNAFENIQKLDHLYLDSISNMSIILTGQQAHTAKMVKRLTIRRSNIHDVTVYQTMENLANFSNLNKLEIHYNNFSNFEYNFTQSFPNLYELDLNYNYLEKVQIQSRSLRKLFLNGNRITELNVKMLENLINLRELYLQSNLVAQIEPSILHYRLDHLYLSSNNLSKIQSSTFCGLKNLKELQLSNNNLGAVKLSCLESVTKLYLSNVQLDGSIDEQKIGNLKNVNVLDLSNNNIQEIDFSNLPVIRCLYLRSNKLTSLSRKTLNAVSNVNYLDISSNKIEDYSNFNNLINLRWLYFNNNLIKYFSDQNLASLTRLEYLGLGNNMIDDIKIENLKTLKNLYLQSNRIDRIRKNTFSSLSNLQRLNLNNNLLTRININAFKNNTNLLYLHLGSNRLKTIADLSELAVLRTLDLSNNKITRLPNYAFERKISEANLFVTQISINLLNNPIEVYSSKSLCSQFSYSFGFAGITLSIDDVNIMPKCMLKQLKSDRTVIYSRKRPSCEMLLMAKKENITLPANLSPECDPSLSIDDCSSNSRFKCPKGEDFIRHTTWITGDPHVFSYKNNYELCSIGSDAICFQHGSFVLYCSDKQIGRADQIASVLTKIKFVFKLQNGANVTFEANQTSFPTTFDNGLDYINEYTDDIQNNKSVEMIVTTRGIVPYRILFIEDTKTHILISRWNSFYSIMLRAKHETYTGSLGYLYEGCQTTGNNENFSMRRKRSDNQKRCSTLCSGIKLEVDDENMPQSVIENACMYDCVQVNESFTQMIRASAKLFDLSIQNDSTISEAIFDLNEPLVEENENLGLVRSSKSIKPTVSYFLMIEILFIIFF